ncbi:LuxR C-terminal-related transcriptional regulator [Dryocola sp. BD613]|uniref:LuxR C-terminal-related transcriptional regulator n=1 Tax=Dryocola sp. BD613 TaxID=3133272 RepID=UPI003F50994B
MYKILLVDRCYYSLVGLRQLINKNNTFCIADTDNLLIAREKIIQWQPNMVIADFSGFSGVLHNIQQLSAIYSACGKSTRLMVMQSGEHPHIEEYCRKQGTEEIFSKKLALPALYTLIEQTLNTRPPFRYRQQQTASLLTLREERVLKLWTEAASNEMIAKIMGISPKTVYTYKRNIRMKLGADNRFSLFLSHPQEVA